MGDKYYPLPEQHNFEYALNQSLELAAGELAGVRDIALICRRSGARCHGDSPQRVITLKHFGRNYRIILPEVAIVPEDTPEETVPLKTRILLLHYLMRARGTPLRHQMITFKELPEGLQYFPSFTKRTISPLLRHFGGNPHRLIETAARMGGRQVDFGDMAVTFNAFPEVPIVLVLWHGDSEFPPEANILFDATINDYLPTEDIIVSCESLIRTLTTPPAK